MSNKTALLRHLGLLQLADFLRFQLIRRKNQKKNRTFKVNHPEVNLPPDYLMYESFQLNYYKYYVNGQKTAKWLVDLLSKHTDLKSASILDWGCGPARIIRHLPNLIPDGSFAGTDYNKSSILWCQNNLPGIQFRINGISPPLDFQEASFELVYGISIFTHLSENSHIQWLSELVRILKPKGLLFLTLHGEAFKQRLDTGEQQEFKSGNLVVRGKVKEGHRTYTAFHPETWVRKWSSALSVVEHIAGSEENPEQDVWIFRK